MATVEEADREPSGTGPEPEDEVEAYKMSLTEHLDELRTRLIRAIAAVFVLAIAAYVFKDPLLEFLIRPLQGTFGSPEDYERLFSHLLAEGISERVARRAAQLLVGGLIFTHPVEAFFTYIKLSLLTGLLAGMPWVLHQLWRFVMPALYRHERRYLVNFLVFGSVLFYTGVVFCFLVVLPLALQFLIGIGGTVLSPLFSVGNYVSFTMLFMLVFGLSFEMPLAMYIVVKIGLIQRQTLVRQWRFVILGAFLVGAMFTPPDIFTQVAMASAIVLLYGVGLLITRFAKPEGTGEETTPSAAEAEEKEEAETTV